MCSPQDDVCSLRVSGIWFENLERQESTRCHRRHRNKLSILFHTPRRPEPTQEAGSGHRGRLRKCPLLGMSRCSGSAQAHHAERGFYFSTSLQWSEAATYFLFGLPGQKKTGFSRDVQATGFQRAVTTPYGRSSLL